MANSLLRTPLYDLIVEQKAKMTAFSGWEMPVQFTGLKLEHQTVRNEVGMFDISHMAKFSLEGEGSEGGLRAISSQLSAPDSLFDLVLLPAHLFVLVYFI